MRWLVEGVDGTEGGQVSLTVEGADAAEAVRAAHGKGIVVYRVGREGGQLRRAGLVLMWGGLIVLAGACGTFWWMDRGAEQAAATAREESVRLAGIVASGEAMMKRMEVSGSSRELIVQLEAAKTRAQGLEGALITARSELARKGNVEAQLALAQTQLRAGEAERTRLTRELADRDGVAAGAVGSAEEARAKLVALDASKKELAGQVDMLKGQLLVAVAKPAEAAKEIDTEAASPARGRMRWPLRTTYDKAGDFLAMHFDKESMRSLPLEDGAVTWSGTSAANASSVEITHDAKKQSVYAAALVVSLAADGPKEKLEENMKLVGEFVRVFAPGVKEGDTRAARLVGELSGKDASERAVLVGGDVKLSVWNNGEGLYTWRVESVGNELE